MTLVVDASIAAKWLFEEAGSTEARTLLSRDDLAGPMFLLLETFHIQWRRYRREEADWETLKSHQSFMLNSVHRFVPDGQLIDAAIELAMSHKQPVYDCLYIALAQRENAPLATDDERQALVARKAGVKVERL